MKPLLPFLLLSSLFTGCAKSSTEVRNSPQSVSIPDTPWKTTHTSSSKDGEVRVVQDHLSDSEQKRLEAQYRRVNLIELPVDAKYNAKVFRISDDSIPDYVNRVFIAPRIFSFGTQDGGKLAPLKNPDQTTTLSFNVAFVDGINPSIETPSSDLKSIPLPDSYRVKEQPSLKSLLSSQFNSNSGLAPLPGCPKKVSLIVADREYDVTPRDFARCDSFQLNVPMVFSVKVSNDLADYILYHALYAGLVDIRATYETRVSYPVSNVHISFDRQKVYEDLKSELGVKTAFADIDVQAAVTKIMKHQIEKVVIQGDVTDQNLGDLIHKVANEFFEPFQPDPSQPVKACTGATVCFRFNYASLTQSSSLDFTWAQVTNTLSGQNYITGAKLKPTPRTSIIGKTEDCTSDCHRLSNHEGPRETGLTVIEGNQVILEPLYAVEERKDFPAPVTHRIHNDRCVETKPHCTREFECHARSCMKIPILTDCEDRCVRTEDQWVDVTEFSSPQSRFEVVENPSGLLPQLYDGIVAQFRWTDRLSGHAKALDCPLNVFPRIGESQSLEIKLMNVPTCSPFTGVPEETPMLYLENRLAFKAPFWTGRRVSDYKGSVTEIPIACSFDPDVELSLKVTMKGFDFEGDSRK